jgi:diphosphomevalonate decarboxylase
MEEAILARDYESFAALTMLDSDHFHELCHTTDPPIHYMNEVSNAVVALVHAFNTTAGGRKVAYTFDAGPNAVLYLLEQHVPAMLAILLKYFPRQAIADSEYVHKWLDEVDQSIDR